VTVLTMFQVDLDVSVDLDINFSKCIFFAAKMTEDKIVQYLL
jgi:hypothetical protein